MSSGQPAAGSRQDPAKIRSSARAAALLLYLALAGSFCGLEIDTFVSDLPFFQVSTLLLFVNVLGVMAVPPLLYGFFSSRRRRWIILVLNTLYFHAAAFLAIYKSARKIDFDFYFFWYNTADALPVLWKIYAPWFFVLALTLAGFVFLQKPAFTPLAGKKFLLLGILGASALCQAATLSTVRGSAAGFLYASFFSDRRLREDYRKFYGRHIAALRSEKTGSLASAHPSALGDAVFFIKQESLSGLLARPRITPQLLRASRDGILFPDFYANSIQSLRGYECILCGIPPSLTEALVDEYTPEELKGLDCLPEIFRSLGYRTLYFFGGSRNARIVRFAESIGFERVLADEIMQPGDTRFDWGYREDVFYFRVWRYLEQRHANEKLFVFIDTGATNHTPFKVLDDRFADTVPFPRPRKFEENLSNATFVQDAYFGSFYDDFRRHYGARGSLFVASDHAWPVPVHKNNIYNERGAYEENFRIPFLFIPPSSPPGLFAAGTVVRQRFSQMDIVPTVLNLIGLEKKRLLGESFAPWLLSSPKDRPASPARTKILIQPYGGGFIAAVQYPRKYLFDVLGKRCEVYDLEKDLGERSPSIDTAGRHIGLIKEFFNLR